MYGQRVIIQDLTLSFYYGAKIGMLGKNGTGKSTLLRIMAGEDPDFDGKLWHHPTCRIGHVSQEPAVDLAKDVRGVVEEGVADRLKLEDDYNAIWETIGDFDPESDEYQQQMDKAGKLQEKMDNTGSWKADVERELDLAANALELPPWDPSPSSPVVNAGGSPCAARCSASRTCCCWTNPRTISTRRPCAGCRCTWSSSRAPSSP
jgi:YD repeat-containing protein